MLAAPSGAGPCGAGAPARVPVSPALPAPLAGTTRGPVNNAASPRPSARRFSTIFSFSFSPAAVLFIFLPLSFRLSRRVFFFAFNMRIILSESKDPVPTARK